MNNQTNENPASPALQNDQPLAWGLEIALIALLGLVALVTRIIQFYEAPYLGFVDVGAFADNTLPIYRGDITPLPWKIGWGHHPYTYAYLLIPFFQIFGPGILAQKMAVLVFSLVSLVFTYLLVREMANNLCAVLATAILVLGRFFLFYSRYPLEPMGVFMIFVVGLYLFRRGFLIRSSWGALGLLWLSAFCLMYSQYYPSARLLYPVFFVYFWILFFRLPNKPATFLRAMWFGLWSLLLIAPFAYEYWVHRPEELFARQTEIGIMGTRTLSDLASNHWQTMLSFINKADAMAQQNVPGICMTNPAIAALLVIGLVASLLLIRHEAVQLGLITFFFSLPATALTVEPYNSKRLLNAMLGVAILGAFPTAYLINRWGKRVKVLLILPLGVLAALVYYGYQDYKILFVEMQEHPACVDQSGYHQVCYALETKRLSQDRQVFLSRDRIRPQGASFHPMEEVLAFDSVKHVPLSIAIGQPASFLLEDKDSNWLDILKHFYPCASYQQRSFKHNRSFSRYDLTASDIEQAFGLVSQSGDSREIMTWSGNTLQIPASQREKTYTLSGLVFVENNIEITIPSDQVESATVLLDGKTMVGQPSGIFKNETPEGWLPITIQIETKPNREITITSNRHNEHFVASPPPPTGYRQVNFLDRLGKQIRSVCYVPTQLFYSRWGNAPQGMTAFVKDIVVHEPGNITIRFKPTSRARLLIPGYVTHDNQPNQVFERTIQFESAGTFPMVVLIDMNQRYPRFELDISTPTTDPAVFASQASQTPLDNLLTLVNQSAGLVFQFGEFEIKDYEQGWGELQTNRNVQGSPIRLDGETYTSGLGTHAPASIKLGWKQPAQYLTGACGLDQSKQGLGSVRFQILNQGQVLFDSGMMDGTEAPEQFRVSVEGINEVTLKVEEVDNLNHDHANWVNLELER